MIKQKPVVVISKDNQNIYTVLERAMQKMRDNYSGYDACILENRVYTMKNYMQAIFVIKEYVEIKMV